MRIILILLMVALGGCTSIPKGLTAVDDFNLQRYLGEWHEIARLDHSFERGLSRITAEYRLNETGGITVINSGYNDKSGERESAEGVAYFIDEPDKGSLEVSFFWPFYGGYHIIELDKVDYQYAMISGPNRDYFWILARKPTLPESLLKALVNKAKMLGFETEHLIYNELMSKP